MSSFDRNSYLAIFAFARQQYHWHESTGRGFDLDAAIIMDKIEGCIGQLDMPIEARERLREMPKKIRDQRWKKLTAAGGT